nr:hypothetical protein [Tanacetum cinerariifolium]
FGQQAFVGGQHSVVEVGRANEAVVDEEKLVAPALLRRLGLANVAFYRDERRNLFATSQLFLVVIAQQRYDALAELTSGQAKYL